MVSQAARVGAMTMTRPVEGSAATNASWSGGRVRSWTSRSTDQGRAERAGARVTAGSGRRLALRRVSWPPRRGFRVLAVLPIRKDHPRVRRPVADGRRAIGGCRLPRRGDVVDPDAAHARWGQVRPGDRFPRRFRRRLLPSLGRRQRLGHGLHRNERGQGEQQAWQSRHDLAYPAPKTRCPKWPISRPTYHIQGLFTERDARGPRGAHGVVVRVNATRHRQRFNERNGHNVW